MGTAMQASKEALLHWIAAGGGFIHPALDTMADVGRRGARRCCCEPGPGGRTACNSDAVPLPAHTSSGCMHAPG